MPGKIKQENKACFTRGVGGVFAEKKLFIYMKPWVSIGHATPGVAPPKIIIFLYSYVPGINNW